MALATSFGVRSGITKIAVAGVLIAIPAAGVSVPVHATPGFGGTSNPLGLYGVHPPQSPATPSTNAPPPPPPPPPPAQPPAYDSWAYGQAGGGGGGG